uniref:BHLH domain-containing protein n=1 Tax=Ascaris lumbricoides TaxID=6252 RepID=A0A9J2PN70_ASCLU
MSRVRNEVAQNNRERKRQLHVNEAFNQACSLYLRQIIPCYPINKKMSKQEILRGAIRYLRILEYLLAEGSIISTMNATLFDNFEETSEPIECLVFGEIPQWLRGTVVRNGPGIYSIGGVRYKHWFDGLALLQRFHFEDGKMWYSCRYLKSDTYKQNITQKRIVISAFGTRSVPDPRKNIFQRLLSWFEKEPLTDNASSHFIRCGDAIYATGETPYVYRVDPDSLETVNDEDLSNYVAVNTMTSHCHYDEQGNIYNVGARFGRSSKYIFVKTETRKENGCTGFGRTSIVGECSINDRLKPGYVHSFGITPSFIIFFEGSLRINLMTIAASRFTRKSCQDCFDWLVGQKTIVHLINRHTGKEVSVKIRAGSFSTFHHANSFEYRRHIFIDYIRYDRLGRLEDYNMDNMRSGKALFVDGSRRGYLHRMIIPIDIPEDCIPGDDLLCGKDLDPNCGFIKQKDGSFFAIDTRLSDVAIEFPQYNYDRFNMKPYQYVYGSAIQGAKGSTTGVVKVDVRKRDELIWSKDNEDQICAEPVFIANPDGTAEDDGVLVCPIVTLHEKDKPLVVILNAATMHEIARCTVNTRLPLGFHSVFVRTPRNN